MQRQFINNDQKKLIHIAKRKLGLDDETYRDMLQSVAGVRSSSDLSPGQFSAVMTHMEKCGFAYVGKVEKTDFKKYLDKWANSVGERPDMATPAQLAKIEEAWEALPWYWMRGEKADKDRALRGFIRRLSRVADMRFLTFIQAGNIIEAIKMIAARGPGSTNPLPDARTGG
jgi:hypothetical protein